MKKHSIIITIALIISIVVVGIISFIFYSNTLQAGVTAASAVYNEKVSVAEQDAYNLFYDSNYELAEKKYHVSSDVTIAIGEVKEIAKLEVLEVSAVEYIITDSEENDAKIDAWLEVPGTGVYTVDLSAAEYIVDSIRKAVTVRVPRPVLENIRVDEEKIELLHFKDTDKFTFIFTFNNNDYNTGIELYKEQRLEAYKRINAQLNSNTDYIQSAEHSAEKMITHLIMEFNRGIPDLKVSVEFII